MWSVVKFFLVLFLPYIISKALSFLFKRREKSIYNRTTYDKVVSLLSLVFVGMLVYSCFVKQPRNIFEEFNISLEAAGFELRNAFRSYCEDRSRIDQEFAKIYTRKSESENSKEPLEKKRTSMENEYEELLYLTNEMKSVGQRRIYYKFGHAAFLGCRYCVEESDYLLFVVPSMMLNYVLYLIILGLNSYRTPKKNWTSIGVLAMVILFGCECLMHFESDIVQPDFYDLFFTASKALRYQKIVFTRNFVLAVYVLILLLIDNGSEDVARNLASKLIKDKIEMLNILHASNIQKTAIMQDTNLRKEYFEFYKTVQAEKDKMAMDPELQKYQKELLHRYDLDKLISEAMEMVEIAMKTEAPINN